MASTTHQGGCLCGAVRYRFASPPRDVSYCHCRMCQQAGGTPVVAWATIATQDFAWTAAPPQAYRSSDKAQRYFCATCGSPLVFQEDANPDELDLAVASLDDPASFAPTHHSWVASRLPWFDTDDRLPRYQDGSAP